ncbi:MULTISPECIES: N-acetylglucosamine kinase [Brevibacterium]|uniref:BadF-type ATPase n=2 Tax=Brevibacterium TaxID=1696 RepID=A0A1H1U0J6_BRESA|nr:BadF/BadG/BcrA/BcrD ATPase family protein [Brevibacterium sandarakinum]SDS65419.1 BadF-type ATPase [Brevibacterium sandarakinum]
MSGFVLGIDIGGTGSRIAISALNANSGPDANPGPEATTDTGADHGGPAPLYTLTGPGVSIGANGSSAPQQIRSLVSAAGEEWPECFESLRGVGIGATGIASLSTDVGELPRLLAFETKAETAVAVDAVTAHLGALSGRGGAVTVLGTGAIAIAHPGPDVHGILLPRWKRVDGWGHLFGDRGGGAWLGRCALEAALKCHDGVDDRGAALLDAARERFGDPATWPAQFYTRSDRAGLLAAFAVDVARLDRTGDPVSTALLAEAGREAARSAIAAGSHAPQTNGHGVDAPPLIALTGGLRRSGESLVEEFRSEAHRLSAETTVIEPAGGPLNGALTLASLVAERRVRPQPGVLWT